MVLFLKDAAEAVYAVVSISVIALMVKVMKLRHRWSKLWFCVNAPIGKRPYFSGFIN